MFEKIETKLMKAAIIVCALGISGSIIGGFIMMGISGFFVILGILTIIGGSLFSWYASLFIYGFGQLLENSNNSIKAIESASKAITSSLENLNRTVILSSPPKPNTDNQNPNSTHHVTDKKSPTASFDEPPKTPAVTKSEPPKKRHCPHCGNDFSIAIMRNGDPFCPLCNSKININTK